jgi:hypothetical protein
METRMERRRSCSTPKDCQMQLEGAECQQQLADDDDAYCQHVNRQGTRGGFHALEQQ